MKKVTKDVFSKFLFSTPKNYMNFIMIYHFYQKERKLKKEEKLVANLYNKTVYVIHITNLKQAVKD